MQGGILTEANLFQKAIDSPWIQICTAVAATAHPEKWTPRFTGGLCTWRSFIPAIEGTEILVCRINRHKEKGRDVKGVSSLAEFIDLAEVVGCLNGRRFRLVFHL
jgi:hypothetical protein